MWGSSAHRVRRHPRRPAPCPPSPPIATLLFAAAGPAERSGSTRAVPARCGSLSGLDLRQGPAPGFEHRHRRPRRPRPRPSGAGITLTPMSPLGGMHHILTSYGFSSVFLSVRRMVSWETLSTWPSSTSLSARRRSVQRHRPALAGSRARQGDGGGPPCSPSSIRGRRGRGRRTRAPSRPSSTNKRRTRWTAIAPRSSASLKSEELINTRLTRH